jgi:hypothetical protein
MKRRKEFLDLILYAFLHSFGLIERSIVSLEAIYRTWHKLKVEELKSPNCFLKRIHSPSVKICLAIYIGGKNVYPILAIAHF